MFSYIWERYFFKEFCKVLLLFVVCFYGLYILIDYSNHTTNFHHHQSSFQWKEFFVYYLCEFIKRSEVLIPFALIITTVKTLCNLNVRNELVALLSSGISMQKLLRPFVFIGLFFTLILYLNTEFFLPKALKSLRLIQDSNSRLRRGLGDHPVQYILLDDDTRLIYQNYNSSTNSFYDAFWIKNIDEVYRFKLLYSNLEKDGVAFGENVEHLKRNGKGELIEIEYFEKKNLPELKFNQKTLFETVTPVEEKSFTQLIQNYPKDDVKLSEKEATIKSVFYYKLFMPWLCLLAVIGPAPYCVRFNRMVPLFFIYACSIFGLGAFYLVMESAELLGERLVLNPLLALGVPFVTVFTWCLYKFIRLR